MLCSNDADSLLNFQIPWPPHLAMLTLQEVQEHPDWQCPLWSEALPTEVPNAYLLSEYQIPDEYRRGTTDRPVGEHDQLVENLPSRTGVQLVDG